MVTILKLITCVKVMQQKYVSEICIFCILWMSLILIHVCDNDTLYMYVCILRCVYLFCTYIYYEYVIYLMGHYVLTLLKKYSMVGISTFSTWHSV